MPRKELIFGLLLVLPASIAVGQAKLIPPPDLKPVFQAFNESVTKASDSAPAKKREKSRVGPTRSGETKRRRTASNRLYNYAPRPTTTRKRSTSPARVTEYKLYSLPTSQDGHPHLHVWRSVRRPTTKSSTAPHPGAHSAVRPPLPATWTHASRVYSQPTPAPTPPMAVARWHAYPAVAPRQHHRNAAISHLQSALHLLKSRGDASAARAIEHLIAAQRKAIKHDMIAAKQAEIERLKKEIEQLAASIHPRQVLVAMTVSTVDLNEVAKLGIDLPQRCLNGECRFHLIEGPGNALSKQLRQLREKGAVKVLSQPQIITLENRMATVQLAVKDNHGRPIISTIKVHPRIIKGTTDQIAVGLEVACQAHLQQKGKAYPSPVKTLPNAKLVCTIQSGRTAVIGRLMKGSQSSDKKKLGWMISLTPTLIQAGKHPVAGRTVEVEIDRLPARPRDVPQLPRELRESPILRKAQNPKARK